MKILVVRTDKLGDFITTLPAIYLLKQESPESSVTVCVAPLNKHLAEVCPFIDGVILYEKEKGILDLAKKIKKENFDVSITMFSNTEVALAQFLARVPLRIAPATKIAQIFYNKRVRQRRSEVKMAEFEYNIELARTLFPNMNCEYKQPLLTFDDAKQIYDVFCINNDIERDVMAFHVGFGGSSDANWSTVEYERLIRAVVKKRKYQVVLTFGPDEKKLYEEMQIRLRDEDVVHYLSLDGLVYFAKLISQFKLFVSTSTGTYHLASLVGCPTMTFFADSLFASAARWKSVGDINLQEHYMLPSDATKREEMFARVKNRLEEF